MEPNNQNDKSIHCTVITPMFTCGADGRTPELRPTELKGLMRYVYRITRQETDSKTLFSNESDFFGSTENPSPLRIRMIERDRKTKWTYLTLHNKGNYRCSIDVDSRFDIEFTYRTYTEKIDKWYKDMLTLSFYLFGMGKRARRGRGCVSINASDESAEEAVNKILELLNSIAGEGKYELCSNDNACSRYKACSSDEVVSEDKFVTEKIKIKPTKPLPRIRRPIIQKILFGKCLPLSENKLDKYLTSADQAGHDTKGENKGLYNDPTGTKIFASSIIVSIVKTTDGYLPVYTYLTTVFNGRIVEGSLDKQAEFQQRIENGVKKN